MGIEVSMMARNEKGQTVTYWEDIDSNNQCEFVGHMKIGFKDKDGNMAENSPVVPTEFEIKAKNIKEAFKRFEPAAAKKLEKANDKLRKPRIEIPDAGTTQAINAQKKLAISAG